MLSHGLSNDLSHRNAPPKGRLAKPFVEVFGEADRDTGGLIGIRPALQRHGITISRLQLDVTMPRCPGLGRPLGQQRMSQARGASRQDQKVWRNRSDSSPAGLFRPQAKGIEVLRSGALRQLGREPHYERQVNSGGDGEGPELAPHRLRAPSPDRRPMLAVPAGCSEHEPISKVWPWTRKLHPPHGQHALSPWLINSTRQSGQNPSTTRVIDVSAGLMGLDSCGQRPPYVPTSARRSNAHFLGLSDFRSLRRSRSSISMAETMVFVDGLGERASIA
jgi:hypothetical protein